MNDRLPPDGIFGSGAPSRVPGNPATWTRWPVAGPAPLRQTMP
jgi:hypothetical protein